MNKGFHKKQAGAILLLMFLLLFVTGSTLVLGVLNNRADSLRPLEEERRQLAMAREALLAYAVNYADNYPSLNRGPGRFPSCPDPDPLDSNDNLSCFFSSTVRLPEKVPLESGSPYQFSSYYSGVDRQFWLGVSPRFRASSVDELNSTTTGAFTLDGRPDFALVLIAPGVEMGSQDRTSWWGAGLHYANYLEQGTPPGPNFTNGYAGSSELPNDQVVGIPRLELMSLVTVKVAQIIKSRIDAYHPTNANSYPQNSMKFANAMDSAPAWFNGDEWNNVANYSFISSDVARVVFDGCAIVFTLEFGGDVSHGPLDC